MKESSNHRSSSSIVSWRIVLLFLIVFLVVFNVAIVKPSSFEKNTSTSHVQLRLRLEALEDAASQAKADSDQLHQQLNTITQKLNQSHSDPPTPVAPLNNRKIRTFDDNVKFDASHCSEGPSNRTIVGTQLMSTKVAYIMFASLKEEWRFKEYVILALQTWLQGHNIFMVINTQWKGELEKLCLHPHHAKVCGRIIPIFVNCPEGHDERNCCKMDQGLSVMWERYQKQFNWFVYQDDDMYIRTKYMESFVSGLDPTQPFIGSNGGPVALGFKKSKCDLSLDPQGQFLYPWARTALYSHAGLERIHNGLQLGAFTKQCQEFHVMHDVGNPIVHWMYELPYLRLPIIEDCPPPVCVPDYRADSLGSHAISRPNQASLADVHKAYGALDFPQPPYQYIFTKTVGYRNTKTYKQFGLPSNWTDEWHAMPVSDCQKLENQTTVL